MHLYVSFTGFINSVREDRAIVLFSITPKYVVSYYFPLAHFTRFIGSLMRL